MNEALTSVIGMNYYEISIGTQWHFVSNSRDDLHRNCIALKLVFKQAKNVLCQKDWPNLFP